MNLKKYNEVFTEIFGVEESELGDGFNFGVAPNWNSLAHMELIAQLEDTFEIMLDTEDITHFTKIKRSVILCFWDWISKKKTN